MKKVYLLFMVALTVTVILGKVSHQGEVTDELLLSNIEALAAYEGPSSRYCVGSGNVKCPDGTKAKYVVRLYDLE